MQTRRNVLRGIGVAGVLGTAGVGAASARPPSEGETIVDVATAIRDESGEFETLVAAVIEAELVGALSGNRQLTVFAPTDETFAKTGITVENGELEIAQGTLDLLESAGLSLADVLLYHVLPGLRDAQSILPVSGVPTLFGSRVDVDGTSLNGGQATITGPDAATASNGIIHIIEGDSVLLP